MKRVFTIFIFLIFSSVIFAQSISSVQRINVPSGFPEFTDKLYMSEDVAMSGGTVVLEYIPETDQVRIIYTCLMTQYQRISARNTCLTVLQDFLSLNKYENDGGQVLSKKRYRSFDYFRPDSEKYIREEGLRKAQYTTFFQLSF